MQVWMATPASKHTQPIVLSRNLPVSTIRQREAIILWCAMHNVKAGAAFSMLTTEVCDDDW